MASRPRRTALCIVLALLASAPAVQAGGREDAQAALIRAETALDRGDPRTARVELMNAIKADPAFADARVAQARVMLELGNGTAARDALDRAETLGVAPGLLRHLRARAALLEGRLDDAMAEARASDADPSQALLLARLEGQALQEKGEYRQAAAAFNRALEIAPDDSALWADIARLHVASGDIAAALQATDQALGLSPDSVDALTLRAMMAREQYGLQASTGWFEEALKRDANHVPALVEYAATLADMGKASRALALTRRALALAPGNSRAYFIQAVMAARAGKYDLARGLLARTGGVLGGQPAMRLLRGVLHLEAGNATLASGELEALLEAQPLNLRARLLLARAHYDDGQYGEAERTLYPLVQRADADSYALSLSARIHEAQGGRVVAAEFLNRAAAMTPGPSEVYRGAGDPAKIVGAANADLTDRAANIRYVRALLEVGQTEAALARARRVDGVHSGSPFAAIMLGDCLMASGRYADAAAAYERGANMRFDENVALRLIDAWRRAGEAGKARRVLGLLLAQNPMNVEGQRLAASFLLSEGEYDRALALLWGLRERLGTKDALLMADMARAYSGTGRSDRALAYAAHAYRLIPASGVTSDVFGWTLFRARPNDRRSLEILEKAQKLTPSEPLVQLHLGLAYAAFGERGKARPMLRAAASVAQFSRRAEAEAALKKL